MSSPVTGINPDFLEQIKALMGQMAPSDSDKKTALSHGLLQAGFGILANAANNPWVAVGKGASTGLLGYNDELKQIQAQRNQNLQAASTIMPMLMADQYRRSQQGQQPGQQTTGQTVPPQTSDANVVTTPLSPSGQPGQPMPQGPGQGAPTPQTAPPAVPQGGGTIYDEARRLDIPKALVDAAMMSPNPQVAGAALLEKFAAPQSFRPGGYALINGHLTQFPSLSPGTTLVDGKAVPVPGAQEQSNRQEASKEAVRLSLTQPKEVVNPTTGNKEIPAGTALGQLLGNYALPYGAQSPYGEQGTVDPAVAAFAAKSGAGPRDFLSGLGRNGQPATLPMTGGAAGTQGGDGRTTELGPAAKTFLTGRADNALKQEQGIDDAASAAQMDMARNKEVRNLVTNFKPGALTPLRGEAGAIAAAAGLPDSIVTGIAGGNVAAIQAMGKLVVDGAFDSAKVAMAGGGRVTQAEILLKAKNSPNAQLTPEAITAMLDFKDGVNTWNVQKQAAKEDWIASHGNSSVGFMADWNKNHPLTNYTPSDAQLEAALFPAGKPKAGPLVQNSTAIYKAQQAIKNGADPAAVKSRLEAAGIDSKGL